MFDIVKDYFNEYNDQLKQVPMKNLSAIYIKPKKDSHEFLFFERYNDFWTYENVNGKYDYKIDENATIEDLVNQLKGNFEFDENFTVRIYLIDDNNNSDFIKLIIPGHRRHMNQEFFGMFELERLKEVNEELLENDNADEETKQEFLRQMEIVNTDVCQIIRLISAQAHTSETIKLTMNLVSQILSNIPITPIEDKEKYFKDWITFEQAMENPDRIKKFIELDDHVIEEMYLNIRCTRIVKVIYKNIKTNEKETIYYDTASTVFIDPKTNEAYWGEKSIETIDLPWRFVPVKELMLNDNDKIEEFVKFSEMLK